MMSYRKKVEDCRYSNGSIISSLSVFTSNLALEIIDVSESLKLAFLIPLLLLAYFLLSKLEGKLIEKKIERTTQKLIKAGKSGKINLGRTALSKTLNWLMRKLIIKIIVRLV